MMQGFRTCLLLIIISLLSIIASAKSFLLIQGDKITPIYVKVEGKMMPRLGMHYCIIPNLGEGLTSFEVLFQENKYPAQKFNIYIPADGSRSLMLAIHNGKIALYDLISKAYIESGNMEDDTYMPINKSSVAGSYSVQDTDEEKKVASRNSKSDDELVWGFSTRDNKTSSSNAKDEPVRNDDRFLTDVDLNNRKNYKEEKRKKPDTAEKKKSIEEIRQINEAKLGNAHSIPEDNGADKAIPSGNPNCANGSMDNTVFENIAFMIAEQGSDEDKLKLIKSNASSNCFSLIQAKILASEVKSPSARYEVIQHLYPRIELVDDIEVLTELFTSKFLKEKVRDLGK